MSRKEMIKFLLWRIKLLENSKRHYEQNPVLMRNVRIANIEAVQNNLAALKELLAEIMN